MGNLVGGNHQIWTLMILPCHERSSLSSPTWQPGWRSGARLFFGRSDAADATRFSLFAAPVIGVSVIAVRGVASEPCGNNGAALTVVISIARRAVSIIATVNGNIESAVRKDA
jgi:hypothetical protein